MNILALVNCPFSHGEQTVILIKKKMKETPQAGAFGTIATFLFGSMLHFDKAMQDEITFWLQTTAFLISVVVGILTICISIRKIKQKDGKN